MNVTYTNPFPTIPTVTLSIAYFSLQQSTQINVAMYVYHITASTFNVDVTIDPNTNFNKLFVSALVQPTANFPYIYQWDTIQLNNSDRNFFIIISGTIELR
jgi:hypothetical protein